MLQMCVELLKSRNKMQQVIFPGGNRTYVMSEYRVLYNEFPLRLQGIGWFLQFSRKL